MIPIYFAWCLEMYLIHMFTFLFLTPACHWEERQFQQYLNVFEQLFSSFVFAMMFIKQNQLREYKDKRAASVLYCLLTVHECHQVKEQQQNCAFDQVQILLIGQFFLQYKRMFS